MDASAKIFGATMAGANAELEREAQKLERAILTAQHGRDRPNAGGDQHA
jgi:hypothetical protein